MYIINIVDKQCKLYYCSALYIKLFIQKKLEMQSEIFQAFICYNFDDYALPIMKSPNSKLDYDINVMIFCFESMCCEKCYRNKCL